MPVDRLQPVCRDAQIGRFYDGRFYDFRSPTAIFSAGNLPVATNINTAILVLQKNG
jgi:hypothetical protein